MSIRCWITTNDFETRSRCNLKKSGAWRYSRDESTDALCFCYALDDGPVRLWKRGDPPPADLFDALAKGAFFEAHNVFFEWVIWHNVMVRKYDWPPLDMEKVVCSAARAAAACYPRSLDMALSHAGIDFVKGDQTAMRKLSSPRKPTKNDKREWHDEPALFNQLYDYCEDDVEGERRLSDKLPALSRFERRCFIADMRINLRGLRVDMEFVHAAITVRNMLMKELEAELMELTDCAVMAPTERDRILNFLERKGLMMTSLDQESVEDALYYEDLTPLQRRILVLRQEGTRSSLSKYDAFMNVVDLADDTVRGLFMYFGANATGRWAGRLIQPQNFPRGNAKGRKKETSYELMERMVDTIKVAAMLGDIELLRRCFTVEESEIPGDPLSAKVKKPAPPAEVLSSALRGAFVARPGKTYGVGDYSAIEARVLFWIAEEEYGLSVYREGGDIYRDMGSVIFGKPPEDLDVGFERMMGKTTVLGCGYGMAAPKFIGTCKSAYGIIIKHDLAERSVSAYRKRYKMVPKLWYAVGDAAFECVNTGTPTKYKKLSFRMDTYSTLRMKLPSGRELLYRRARIEDGQIVFINGKGHREHTYGGKLVENACQAIARDILADAVVRAEFDRDEIDVVLHAHDELVAEGEPGVVGKAVQEVMDQMPDWAEGLPMKIEVWESPRYHK